MKNLLFLLFCSFAITSSATDVLKLSNGMTFEGTVIKVGKCSLSFAINDIAYTIPASDIYSVEFDNISKIRAKKISRMINSGDNCFSGTSDGAMHGHKGGQFCAGFFGGFIGFAIVAIVDRSPSGSSNLMLIGNNRELWNDLSYLTCYEKQSKKEAMKMAGIGCGSGALLYLMLVFSAY